MFDRTSRRDALDTLHTRILLGRPLTGLSIRDTDWLDWHVKNSVMSHSGTAQLTSYNGLVDFVGTHYAAALGQPLTDDLYERTIQRALKGHLPLLRKANSKDDLKEAFLELAKSIDAFLTSARAPAPLTRAQQIRRAAIASAIWETRCQVDGITGPELAELPPTHSVWAEADAVMAVLVVEAQ